VNRNNLVNPVLIEIEIKKLRKLISFILEAYGYDFSNYAISSFKRRVQRIMQSKKHGTIELLIKSIKKDKDFFEDFLSEVTVNVTEMFRDPAFWKEIRDFTIPRLFETKDHLRIWHAGCSSGEEVLSMAIMLKEMNLLDKVTIVATDLDVRIINQARSGFFQVENLEVNESNYAQFQGKFDLLNYCESINGKVEMDKTLMENVSFKVHDLVKGGVFEKFDLILCRNVMIYFNQMLQNSVLKKLHQSLNSKGYLSLGSKESIGWSQVSNKFKVVNNSEKIYQKIKD